MTDLLDRPTPPARRRRLPRAVGLLVVLLVLGGLLLAIALGARSLVDRFAGGPEDFSGQGEGSVVVQVQPGDTATAIGQALAEAGVVASAAAFADAAAAEPASRGIQPGSYTLRAEMSGAAALGLLLDPASRVLGRVVVPEGLRVEQVLERVAEGTEIPLPDLQAAAADPAALGLPAWAPGLEGLLFPATYDVEPGDTATQVLTSMVARFLQEADALGLEERAAALGVTPYEAVVVASLAEREARLADEYAKVARVVYNRLEAGMRLDIDATVLYGLGRTSGGLTREELDTPTPYNTRLNVRGLPPTPIASPGTRALEAALAPAEGPWVWYVLADEDGTQFYTESEDEFLRQKAQSERDGLL